MLCRPKYPVVTLTTDFGLQDHYVASMKGVILSINPATPIVDITHEIPPFSILSGAYAISQAAPCFPPNTVHIVVVDPGVGTARRAILLQAGGQIFIGPDNGVFSMITAGDPEAKCFEITRRDLMRSEVSSTFHGRDIFAPVGAAVACGKAMASDVGPQIFDWKKLDDLAPQQIEGESWRGKILSVDCFGNLITNFQSSELPAMAPASFEIEIAGQRITRRGATFGEVPSGELLMYPGSAGYVEIGVNQGSAAQRLGAAAGQVITLQRTGSGEIRQSEILEKAL
jgi:S-adenosylmethionine hydrolase